MKSLIQELVYSGWIHRPLPLHEELSLEAEERAKRVVRRRAIPCAAEGWTAEGNGSAVPSVRDGIPCVRMAASSPVENRPRGMLEEGDCSNLGAFRILLHPDDGDWSAYNRLSFRIFPDCAGIRRVHLRLDFINDGAEKIPDPYFREGFHVINLTNGRWNDCSVQIPTMPRDNVTSISFNLSFNGCETEASLGNWLRFDVGALELQQVSPEEHDHGWSLDLGEIAWCYSGYLPHAAKIAVLGADAPGAFEVLDAHGQVVFASVTRLHPDFPHLAVMDFSPVRVPGDYCLRVDNRITSPFPIGADVWLPSAWKTLNFLFCERCGYPVPGVHLSCHRDVIARHGGKSFVFNGGWHDAGDVSQQLIQTAEVTFSLFELAAALEADVAHASLRARLIEEALWGLDYVLRSRFGDGFRATSVGTSMWSQGFIGDADDISARVHDNAYENFLCAGVEAYASRCLAQSDPALAARTLDCARADFRFARERFARTGFSERPPVFWEHSWMTSESAFTATMAWAAVQLYSCTGEDGCADFAAQCAQTVLACQYTRPIGDAFPSGGFFLRSAESQVPVHFSHQARDQIFAQMLDSLLRAMPEHPDAPQWLDAARRHADYLQRLFAFASPYGMMPAGVYHIDEPKDRESFERQHLMIDETAYDDYAVQLRAGRELCGGYFVRQFPVWFSFRGNNAVLLSQAKAAALLGRLLGNSDLLNLSVAQLEWNLGKNPFRQSLMYGEGRRYAQQYAVLPGESTGELPVGVQTRGNEDVPYWPQMNNATYKEVWTTPSARWLSVLAEFQKPF